MSIIGNKGYPVSYECSELLKELKRDIAECGKDKLFIVWLREYPEHGVEIAVNYDFYVEELPFTPSEIDENERIVIMSGESLYDRLMKQNDKIQAYRIDE